MVALNYLSELAAEKILQRRVYLHLSIAEKIHPKHSQVLPRIELLELQIQDFELVAESLFRLNQPAYRLKTELLAGVACFVELGNIAPLLVVAIQMEPERIAVAEQNAEPGQLNLAAE